MFVNNSIIEQNRGEREAKSLYEFPGGWLQIKRMIYGEENRERNLLNIYLCYVVKKKREGGKERENRYMCSLLASKNVLLFLSAIHSLMQF